MRGHPSATRLRPQQDPAARRQRVAREAWSRIVQKFGGTSVADIERIKNAADRVKREVDAGSRGRRRRFGDGRHDQSARRLGAPDQQPARCARIRCRRRLRRAGDRRADGDGAAGHRHRRALLARLAGAAEDRRRPRQGPHRRHRYGRSSNAAASRARWRSSPGSRGSGRATASRRSAAAGRIRRRWHWRRC